MEVEVEEDVATNGRCFSKKNSVRRVSRRRRKRRYCITGNCKLNIIFLRGLSSKIRFDFQFAILCQVDLCDM